MSGIFRARFASLLVLGLLGFTCISGLSVVQPSSATTKSQVALSSSGSSLVGGELWLNDSYPFQSEARSSTILALPTLSAWLGSHGISIDQLRPYVTLWSSQGNPYDYAQGTVGFADNGTVYKDYDYILPNGTVIGVAVSEGSPEVVAAVSTFPSQDNTLSSTGYTVDSENGAGHQAEGPNSLTNYFDGAEYNTTVFSDLTDPSSCGTYCWYWVNWLGTSNYDWTSGPGSSPFFFQVELAYWGGNEGEPSNCGSSSYTSNCVFFQYALDSTTLNTYTPTPNIGDWAAGDSVTMEWTPPTANCSPQGGVSGFEDWVVNLKVTNQATGQYASYGACFPDNLYLQFLEERPLISGTTLAQNPEFGTHDFSGAVYKGGSWVALNSGPNTWKLNMYNAAGSTELVSSTTLSNGASGSTWNDSWLSSSYP